MTDVQHFLAEYIKGTYSTSFLEDLAIEASIRAKVAQDPLNIDCFYSFRLSKQRSSVSRMKSNRFNSKNTFL